MPSWHTIRTIPVLAAFALLGLVPCSTSKVVTLQLDVRTTLMSLDGVKMEFIVANGQVPGPAVYMDVGDTLRIELTNKMDAISLSIHCHGFLNGNNSWYDGPGHVTQCPVHPLQKFVYTLPSTGERGTFWYHEHHVILRTFGLYGPIIIRDPADPIVTKYRYTQDEVLMIGDLWHQGWSNILTGLREPLPNWMWPGDPNVILHNGKGCFGDMDATLKFNLTTLQKCYTNTLLKNASLPTDSAFGSMYTLDVRPGTAIRLRLIGATGMSIVTFAIEGHNLTVVERDGQYMEPYTVSSVEVNSGQRISVIIKTHAKPTQDTFWMISQVQFRKQLAGVALLRYRNATELPSQERLLALQNLTLSLPSVDWRDVKVYNATLHNPILNQYIIRQRGFGPARTQKTLYGTFPPKATRTLFYVSAQAKAYSDKVSCTPFDLAAGQAQQNCNASTLYMVWTMNNSAFDLPETPLLLSIYAGKPLASNNIVYLNKNDVVDIVIQNAPSLSGISEQHPWHMHGHHFWLLGQGAGLFNVRKPPPISAATVSLRDTVTAYPHTWTWIRFVADNPGVWMFHCHVEWHVTMGMSIVFAEQTCDIQPPPDDFPTCGEVTRADFYDRARRVDIPATATVANADEEGFSPFAISTIVLSVVIFLLIFTGSIGFTYYYKRRQVKDTPPEDNLVPVDATPMPFDANLMPCAASPTPIGSDAVHDVQ